MPPVPLSNHEPAVCPYGFAVSDISYTWGHTVYGLFRLASCTRHDAFKVQPRGSLCLNFSPSYGRMTRRLSVHFVYLSMDTWAVPPFARWHEHFGFLKAGLVPCSRELWLLLSPSCQPPSDLASVSSARS